MDWSASGTAALDWSASGTAALDWSASGTAVLDVFSEQQLLPLSSSSVSCCNLTVPSAPTSPCPQHRPHRDTSPRHRLCLGPIRINGGPPHC